MPIPHTAIITERKEQFGETLGEFIQSSFLTGDAVAERVRAANVGDRVARWLAEPANADRLAGHVLGGAVEVVDLLEDEAVHDVLERLVRERLEAASIVPMAGRALGSAHQGGPPRRGGRRRPHGPRPLPRRAPRRAARRGSATRRRGGCPAPSRTASSSACSTALRAVLDDMAHDRGHGLRQQLDAAHPAVRRRAADLARAARQGRAAHPRPARAARAPRRGSPSAWTDAKAAAPRPVGRSRVRRSGSRSPRRSPSGGERLLAEPALVAKIDDAAEAAARYVVEHFGGEINQLVSTTIARWDGEETSERLELLLGPDLQFIRINGTVVGGARRPRRSTAVAQVLG